MTLWKRAKLDRMRGGRLIQWGSGNAYFVRGSFASEFGDSMDGIASDQLLMPRALMREASVVGFIPSRAAAPSAP